MGLTTEQVEMLIGLACSTSADDLDCDGCHNHLAEFVEVKLAGKTFCESMQLVEQHLRNCPCCKDEFEAFQAALVELGEPVDDPES